ncbi:MAG: hypothetical protein D3922_06840 [Candidatus Electrothrix sp. AR1]|nr:hypothetical protein [Candidatus Electrothrix sp. AR1]
MHRYKNSTEKPSSPPEEYPEPDDQDKIMICENLKCTHYDQQDPGGNNCTLLFALSEEGCGTYAQSLT